MRFRLRSEMTGEHGSDARWGWVKVMAGNVFEDPALVANYAELTPLRVPGLQDLHRMAAILLSEQAGREARILVLGAGGGLELRAFARARPHWSLVGVDPSRPMLELARKVAGDPGPRMELVHGEIEDAPGGPFDGATCLLTFHFLSVEERLHNLRELRKRLRPRAPLIIAHHCRPKSGHPTEWLARSAVFAAGGDVVDPHATAQSASAMAGKLVLLSEDEEVELLRESGFIEPALFYAGLSFRGWVAYAEQPPSAAER